MKRSNGRRLLLLLVACAPLVVSNSQRAEPESSPSVSAGAEDAAVCEVPATDPSADLRDELARAAARPNTAARDVIVLNAQGYNYGADERQALEKIHEELLRQSGER